MTDAEKQEVSTEYNTLLTAVKAYNAKVDAPNKAISEATEVAFASIVTLGFSFLAGLWFLLKKKFI